MATVELSFSALPAHVRTARLVAAAVARRSGVDEAVLDEVRLAVGEACSRAVDLHRRHCPAEPVRVRLIDGAGGFCVEVGDSAPAESNLDSDLTAELTTTASLDADAVPGTVGLALIRGLVDEFAVEREHPVGVTVRMSWPTATGR